MNKIKKRKLSRYIKENVKLAIRQKCGFGCVICGNAIIQYHHFNPTFAEAESHAVEGITLLCGTCHDMVHKNMISMKKVMDADAKPYCINTAPAKSKIFLGDTSLPVKLGPSSICAKSIFKYDNNVIFGFNDPEYIGAPIRLNAIFTDNVGREILCIENNEWIVGSDCFDIEITHSQMTIKKKSGEVSMEMDLSMEGNIQINKIDMEYKGFKIIANKDSFDFKVPGGSGINFIGSSYSEIGIWMKSNGQALIAANREGGAAISI